MRSLNKAWFDSVKSGGIAAEADKLLQDHYFLTQRALSVDPYMYGEADLIRNIIHMRLI